VLVEKSLIGWKEYELEVMRDTADNCVIVCSIENVDPMGVHTGDSITVAPSQTLTDREYQRLRDAAIAIIREMGVECGGSNVQMAINPADGEMVIIEMNPRVSRSSALASKATGFPIAKFAAKLAVGYTLDQIANDITQKTPASFEPSIDYIVTKIPRFAFEKFPGTKAELTTMMKSVGEVMAIGRTWQESLQKALRGMETGLDGWSLPKNFKRLPRDQLIYKLRVPNPERMTIMKQAFEDGFTPAELFELTKIDPWWLAQLQELHDAENWVRSRKLGDISKEDMQQIKTRGFSDAQIAACTGARERARARPPPPPFLGGCFWPRRLPLPRLWRLRPLPRSRPRARASCGCDARDARDALRRPLSARRAAHTPPLPAPQTRNPPQPNTPRHDHDGGARVPQGPGRHPLLQAGGHVRRRVCGRNPLHVLLL
jgi:carbamoyl-phosphate synthase large subunit